MSTVKAVASGPILFTTSTGDQLSIPASALRFTDGSLVVPTPFAGAAVWLNHLVTIGFIQPEPSRATPGPSTTPVMTLTAASPGEWGNNITTSIAYDTVTPPADPTYTIAVSASISLDLNMSTIANVLGTNMSVPTQATPVFVPSSTLTTSRKPRNVSATPLTAGVCAIKDSTNATAFEIQTRKTLPSGTSMTAAITNSNETTGSFTLTLSCSTTPISLGVDVPSSPSTRQNILNAAFGYLVDIVYNGGKPKAGSFDLTGGIDGMKAHFSTQVVL